jgi:hypothetical protein
MSKKVINKKLKQKKRTFKKKHKRTNKIYFIGGELIMSNTDLNNTHICSDKVVEKYKESPGYEVYTAISDVMELNEVSSAFFLATFTKTNDKWFKFVIFNNNNKKHIYIINGAPINKHSVCMLQGLLDVTRKTGEYKDLRDAFNNVIELKSIQGIDTSTLEEQPVVIQLNAIIARDIPCMPVISAGSGTVNEDGSVCINTKSGHYKPSIESMDIAKELFTQITGKPIVVIMKENKDAIKEKYGARYEQFSGICL